MSWTGFVLAVLAALNLVTWVVYRWDKRQARRDRTRVRQSVLLGLAAAGGFIGAGLGIFAHKEGHKSRKILFVAAYAVICVAWVLLLAWLVLRN